MDREVKFLYNKVKIGKAEKDKAKKAEESKKSKKKKKSKSNSTETEGSGEQAEETPENTGEEGKSMMFVFSWYKLQTVL